MRTQLPFFTRTVLPLWSRPAFWVFSLFVTWFTVYIRADLPATIVGLLGIHAVVAGFATLRRMDDDYTSGTLEQLEMLPVSRARIALEVAAGAFVGFLPYALLPLLAAVVRTGVDTESMRFLCALPPFLVLPALLGALASMRRGIFPIGWFYAAAVAFFVFNLAARDECPWTAGSFAFISARSLGLLVLEVAGFALAWRAAISLGGSWAVRETARGSTAKDSCGCPLRARGIPDGWNPLFWRELNTGLPVLLIGGLAGLVYVLCGLDARYVWDGPVARANVLLWWIGPWAAAASALRTSRDRTAGMWADLAPTPVPLPSILWTRVRALIVHGYVVGLVWVAVGLLLPVTFEYERDHVWWLKVSALALPLLCGSAGALAGFVTGLSGRGIVAAAGSLVLLYTLGLVSAIPGCFTVGIVEKAHLWPRDEISEMALGIAVMALCFYAPLILGARRGIRSAVAEQRA